MQSGLLAPPASRIKRPKLWRDERQVAVGASDTKILGSNPRRIAVVFATPAGGASGAGQFIGSATIAQHNVDASTTVVKISYTVPANTAAVVDTFGYVLNAGTNPAIKAEYTPNGGTKLTLPPTITQNTFIQAGLAMAAGDVFDLNVTTAGPGALVDLFAGIRALPQSTGGGASDNTVFISLDGTATVNGGMSLHPGAPPFQLLYEHIGQALREEIRGIAASTPVTLTVWDIMEVDCPCQDA